MSRHYLPPAPRGTLPNSGAGDNCAVCYHGLKNERPRRDQRLCGRCNRDMDAYNANPRLFAGTMPNLERYLRGQS